MKAQLTFLGIFMKVLLMGLILALCFMGKEEKVSACTVAVQSSSHKSIQEPIAALLNSVKLVRAE